MGGHYRYVGSLPGQGKGSNWRVLAAGAAAVISLCAVAGNAYAGSPTEPGVTMGFAAGSPIPEGVYFLNSASFGNDRTNVNSNLDIEVPVILWASPFRVLGGQLRMEASVPSILFNDYGSHPIAQALAGAPGIVGGTFQVQSIVEEYSNVSIAWRLGGGWNISQAFGLYAPGSFNGQSWVPEGRTAITYLDHGWNLTANFIYGGGVERVDGQGTPYNSYLNIDLTATKTVGKWEFGAVGFATFDTSVSGKGDPVSCAQLVPSYFNGFGGNTCSGKQERVAVGGLIGYNWGPAITKLMVTRDVVDHNTGASITGPINFFSPVKPADGVPDTRVWTTLVVPLWHPEHHE